MNISAFNWRLFYVGFKLHYKWHYIICGSIVIPTRWVQNRLEDSEKSYRHGFLNCELWGNAIFLSCTSIIRYIIMRCLACIMCIRTMTKCEQLFWFNAFSKRKTRKNVQSFFIMTERHLCFTFTSKLLEIMRCCYLPQGTLHRVFVLSIHSR